MLRGEIKVAEVMAQHQAKVRRLRRWWERAQRDAEWVALKEWWAADRQIRRAQSAAERQQAARERQRVAELYRAELARAWPKWRRTRGG